MRSIGRCNCSINGFARITSFKLGFSHGRCGIYVSHEKSYLIRSHYMIKRIHNHNEAIFIIIAIAFVCFVSLLLTFREGTKDKKLAGFII